MFWTTRRPKDRPPHSTPHPQKEGALPNHNSSNHSHLIDNHRVLQRPLTPTPTPNNGEKGKGNGKSKGKGKTNNGGGSDNSSGGSNTTAWPSFYNPWTDIISIWLRMRPPQQMAHPPEHAMLAGPGYYNTPGGIPFVLLSVPPPH
jgi:hypothetical protein